MYENIPNSNDWVSIEPLKKGWSKDIKYIITDINNQKFLLRISDISLYEKKKKQFNKLQEIEKLNIQCSKPISFGILNDKQVYMVLTYLDGIPADEAIKDMTNEQSYKLGVEAGIILKRLHSLKIEEQDSTWYELYVKKTERKVKALRNLDLPFNNKETLIQYLEKNMHLIKDRPLSFTHGDFHLGNMIVNNGKIGIIDFDKNCIADAYDDFKPFCWNVFGNEYFETGLIDGYFNFNIPNDFFPILALYACESIISHIPWAVQFGEKEIVIGYQVKESIERWFDDFNLTIPTWYKSEYKEESNIKRAYFAGGCFWCMAKPYYEYEGIIKVFSGYMGGLTNNPTYEEVKTGKTGYLETIMIIYDETLISYEQLIDIYIYSIDPFDDGGQYIDRGNNYKCAIFYSNEKELQLINLKICQLEQDFNKKSCISLYHKMTFYIAEEYHQDYHINNPLLFNEEYTHSGRIIKPLIGRFKYNNCCYEIKVINDLIIDIKEIDSYELYDNPSVVKHLIDKILCDIEKIKWTLDYINKIVKIKIDRPLGTVHPKHSNIVYSINYGYVPNVLGGDLEELDCYVLDVKEPILNYTGKCIAVIHRIDEDDDKLVLSNSNKEYSNDEIREKTYFQEQYHKSIIIR